MDRALKRFSKRFFALRVPQAPRPVLFLTGTALAMVLALSVEAFIGGSTVSGGGDGSEQARLELLKMNASSCLEQAVIDYAPWVIAKEADSTQDHWLKSAPLAYVGNITDAISSLHGTVRSQLGNEAVAVVDLDGTATLLRFSSFTTPGGRSVWVVTNRESAKPDSACQ